MPLGSFGTLVFFKLTATKIGIESIDKVNTPTLSIVERKEEGVRACPRMTTPNNRRGDAKCILSFFTQPWLLKIQVEINILKSKDRSYFITFFN